MSRGGAFWADNLPRGPKELGIRARGDELGVLPPPHTGTRLPVLAFMTNLLRG